MAVFQALSSNMSFEHLTFARKSCSRCQCLWIDSFSRMEESLPSLDSSRSFQLFFKKQFNPLVCVFFLLLLVFGDSQIVKERLRIQMEISVWVLETWSSLLNSFITFASLNVFSIFIIDISSHSDPPLLLWLQSDVTINRHCGCLHLFVANEDARNIKISWRNFSNWIAKNSIDLKVPQRDLLNAWK